MAPEICAMQKRRVKIATTAVSDSAESLPDFSADWQLPEPSASNAEVEARFHYEFARESKTILRLTESLCHFTRREIIRAACRTLSYPGHALDDLHPYCSKIVYALVPAINLREVSWHQLEHEQKQSLIREFSRPESPFRRLNYLEFVDFADFAMRAYCWPHPTQPNYTRLLADPNAKPPDGIGPWWYCSSRLFRHGVEEIALRIDWNQGPQAVKAAMEQWFQRHKRGLVRLKSEGKLPDAAHGSYMFHLRDETGAKNPRRKYITALRGLGAMRLLGSHTLLEAIKITTGSGRKGDSLYYGFLLETGQPAGRSAWNRGIENARQTFQKLFYPQDEDSLRVRRHDRLPDIEEPISYQRYCFRTAKNK
jgi:hypothetical protein